MADLPKPGRLKKELSLFSVYAIATGTTLSAGFFLLPGLAAVEAGPAVVLSYLIAAVFLVPALLSIVELATAMPRAGGAYYFLDRSLGPLAGTVGGLGTWLALVLKAAFALVGMGAYVRLIVELMRDRFPAPADLFEAVGIFPIAAGLAILFGIINLLGAKRAGSFQIVLVIGLLGILAWFIAMGSTEVDPEHLRGIFRGFFGERFEPIIATAGLVFISYVGVTNIASVAEEVKNPERNLPLGIFLALGTAVVVYLLGVGVMVGVVGDEALSETLTPVEKTAEVFAGKWGVAAVCLAAMLAFSSVANAGILSASRYPLAMARDHLLPGVFHTLSRRGTPKVSIYVTVGAILLFLFLLRDPTPIAKLASAFQLLMFALLCLAVIVMRQSGLESYDPGFRSPLYPWMQLVGIAAPIWLIMQMGWLPIVFTFGLAALGIGWYYAYARRRVDRHGAIYHVFERLGRRRFAGLDRELRSILKEKGLREEDPFEEVVARARVIDAKRKETFERVVRRASVLLAERLPCEAETLIEGFLQGTRTGATPVTSGVALPHLRLPEIDTPQMVVVRSTAGIQIDTADVYGKTHTTAPTHAIFFLISPDNDPGQHLRLLAELAGRVDREAFIPALLAARDEHGIKEILLRSDRYLTVLVTRGSPSATLIGRAIRDVDFPQGCLVAIIRRAGETIVPGGSTVVKEGDWLTVIGSRKVIDALRDRYESEEP